MPPRSRRTPPEPPTMVQAVQATRSALQLEPADAGAADLAERYAAAIDRAAAVAEALARIEVDDEDMVRRLNVLAARVEQQAVLAELGPKLLQVLAALGATPAARARTLKGGLIGGGPTPLDTLRAARARRKA